MYTTGTFTVIWEHNRKRTRRMSWDVLFFLPVWVQECHYLLCRKHSDLNFLLQEDEAQDQSILDCVEASDRNPVLFHMLRFLQKMDWRAWQHTEQECVYLEDRFLEKRWHWKQKVFVLCLLFLFVFLSLFLVVMINHCVSNPELKKPDKKNQTAINNEKQCHNQINDVFSCRWWF